MEFTPEDVKKLADLARLELSEDEVIKFQKELKAILGYVSKLQELRAETQQPEMAVGPSLELRADTVEQFTEQAQLVAAAPKQVSHMVEVPGVFSAQRDE